MTFAVLPVLTSTWLPAITLALTIAALVLAVLALRRANEAIEAVRPSVDADAEQVAELTGNGGAAGDA